MSPSETSEQLNKGRVVKNTVLLYFRMFFLMIIGFVTTRVILHSLGEIDYGLNNAVAGFVSLFGLLTGSLNAAISRFITYELGKGNQSKLNRIFSTAIYIQFCMALIVALLVETVGLWFLNTHMTIPTERLTASHWVLHFAVINTFITLTFIPYQATIISHEKMGIYAYVSILEGCLKLLIAYLVAMDMWKDRLIIYSGAMCLSTSVVNIIYRIYCKRKFEECHIKYVFDKSLFKHIGSFAGWNLFGSVSGMLKEQGINILFNMFFGPIVNAARGLTNQVSGLSTQFSDGFMTAMKPQITKSYASKNYEYMYSLIFQGSRISFFLFYILALPLFIETDVLLSLWIVSYPAHTVEFIRIAIILLLVENILANPLITLMLATGNIKNYQIVVGGIMLFAFPISWLMLKFGASPEIVLLMVLALSVACMIARLIMLRRMVGFPVKKYLFKVIFRISYIIIISSLFPVVLHLMLPSGIWQSLTICFISVLSGVIIIWFLGLSKPEKNILLEKCRNVYNNIHISK